MHFLSQQQASSVPIMQKKFSQELPDGLAGLLACRLGVPDDVLGNDGPAPEASSARGCNWINRAGNQHGRAMPQGGCAVMLPGRPVLGSA